MKAKRKFHITINKDSMYTWCGRNISANNVDFGGSSPYAGTTCVKCIENYIREKKVELGDAKYFLRRLCLVGKYKK